MNDPDSSGDPHTPIVDEAMHLMSSISEWARRSFPSDPGAPASSDCQWCPLCQFVAIMRGDRPDVTERVAEAGTAVMSALRAMLDVGGAAAGAAAAGAPSEPPAPRVQHIDLADET